MKRICQLSGEPFEISAEDLDFYEKMSVSPPLLCPKERMRLRLSFRNEFSLYRRKCDSTGEDILSCFAPNSPVTVYGNHKWWSDDWDAKDYAREFDFSKTFAENFAHLSREVPTPTLDLAYTTMENSDFCNAAGYLKDCYLLVNADGSERCLYGKGVNRCYDCLDCFKVYDCEGCYETLNANNCTFCTYVSDSQNCTDCHFCASLVGCQDCFGCANLRNQRFHLFNERLSAENYRGRVEALRQGNSVQEIRERFDAFRVQYPVKWMQERHTESCTGDYLVQCKDCEECFDCEGVERSKYCTDLKKGEGVSFGNYDISFFGMGVTECYEGVTIGYGINRSMFCDKTLSGSNQLYCRFCVNGCHDLFGCMSLKKQQYCILNKQYPKDDYLALRGKVIAHMKDTGEWGRFFPPQLSPFAYNDSVAHEYFPLSRDEALSRGYQWQEKKRHDAREMTYAVPESIAEVRDDILNEVLICEASGQPYKIQKAELEFYRKIQIAVPKLCPLERHRRRVATRNPRALFKRKCSRSQKTILSSISPSRPEEVLCEEEYLKLFR